MTVVHRLMTMASRWTKGCGSGDGSTARWMLSVILLLCITSYALLGIPWFERTTNSMEINKNSQGAVRVLLFSYYRSGSTLLGSMFNLNKDAFYWFEPLASTTMKWGWVGDRMPQRNFYHYDNGTEKSIPLDDLRETLSSPLHLIFHCNLTALSPAFFTSRISRWLERYRAFADYHRCLNLSDAPHLRRNRTAFHHHHVTAYRKCLPILVERCRRSSVVAVKTIRLTMRLVEEMFRTDATLRLVYMVRDPRGMLNSWWTNSLVIAGRMRTHRYNGRELDTDARVMCKRILGDWRTFGRLRTRYPDRCLRFRYEDLAASPETVVRRVYGFLGFAEPPSDVMVEMRGLTSANQSDGVYGVRRRNSSVTAQRWRTRLAPNHQRLITDRCHELLHAAGYQ